MNKLLHELYASKWEDLCSEMKKVQEDNSLLIKPTNPLLLHLNELELEKAEIRVMIYGQETNGWFGNFKPDMSRIIDGYNDFYHGGECWSYGGQFWNGFARFKTIFENKYPTKKIIYIWNNIVKIGKFDKKNLPPPYIYEIEQQHFSIIEEELKIIKPDVVLFFTGPDYDKIIVDNFGNLRYLPVVGFAERQLSRVELKDTELAFRTYHPNYLWRNDINKYFGSIIGEIEFS